MSAWRDEVKVAATAALALARYDDDLGSGAAAVHVGYAWHLPLKRSAQPAYDVSTRFVWN